MNIVYFGTDVYIETFKYLNENHNIIALYTYHHSEDYFTEQNIVQIAHLCNIPVYYSEISDQKIMCYIENEDCKLFIAAEYNKKIPIPNDTIKFRGINIHSALLPHGRSYYPIELSMVKKHTTGGVTLHKLAKTLDTGDILAQKSFPIENNDDSIDVYLKCSAVGKTLMKEILEDFENSWNNAKLQTTKLAYWNAPTAEDVTITHDMTVEQAMECYRCFNRICKISIHSKTYYIDSIMTGTAPIGTTDQDVIVVSDRRMIFGLKNGHIRVDLDAIHT